MYLPKHIFYMLPPVENEQMISTTENLAGIQLMGGIGIL